MILVDCNPEHGTRFPFMMVSDQGEDELIRFGSSIGLKKEWLQNDNGVSHFRINALKRKEAILRGAKEANMREIMEAMERAA